MFIGFAISPEWDPLIPLDPASIQIDLICSRHFQQSESHRCALSRILEAVRQELGVPHVRGYPSRVSQVIPHPSLSSTSSEARGTTANGIAMARDLPPPTALMISPSPPGNAHGPQSTGLRGDPTTVGTQFNHDRDYARRTVGELQRYVLV